MESLTVDTSGIITGFVNNSSHADACVQVPPNFNITTTITDTTTTSATPDLYLTTATPINTATSTTSYTTSAAATRDAIPTTSTATTATATPNEDIVKLVEGHDVYIKFIELKDIMRFKNKPREMTRRLLLSIVGKENLKRMVVGARDLNPVPLNILDAVESNNYFY